jgi:hypothetical protein
MLRAEQTVEVVRNGENGTYRFDGIDRLKVSERRKPEQHWKWTHDSDVGGGVVLWTSSREEFGGIRAGPARVVQRGSWTAFTPTRLRGRGKGQCDTFGWSTVEGRAAWSEGCLQLERNEAREVRKFLEDQVL